MLIAVYYKIKEKYKWNCEDEFWINLNFIGDEWIKNLYLHKEKTPNKSLFFFSLLPLKHVSNLNGLRI